MTRKLKQGFFKVSPYNPYIPLRARYYGYEADNTFQIRKSGGTVVSSYYGISHGMGKVLSLFNKEFFLFHNGASQIMCVSPDDAVSTLLNITGVDDASIITMDKNFIVVTQSGSTITVKSYVIAGTSEDFWAELIETKTTTMPGSGTKTYGCKANATTCYACLSVVSGSFQSLKIVGNNTFSPSVTLSWVSGTPQTLTNKGNMLYKCAGNRYYWSNEYNYYVDKNSTAYTLYDKNGTVIWTGTVPGNAANFYIDQETGNGYVLAGNIQDVQNKHIVGNLYSLQNGNLTLVATAANANTGSQSGWYNSDNVMPLVDGLIAPLYNSGYKVTATTSSVSVTSATNTSNTTFGTGVRFA
jgi:hypothetical protein